MIKKIIYLCFLMCLTYNCISQEGHDKDANTKKINAKYQLYKSYYKQSFINHFPIDIQSLPVTITVDTNAIPDPVRFMLCQKLDRDEFDTITNYLNTHSRIKYQANESCLLVVDRFTTKENRHLRNKYKYVDKNQISRDCYKDKLPIPNFFDSDYLSDKTESRLPKDFTIYVLEAKSGKYWDETHLTKGKYMPEGWKNGYSKGVAISKKKDVIIYWFIIW